MHACYYAFLDHKLPPRSPKLSIEIGWYPASYCRYNGWRWVLG